MSRMNYSKANQMKKIREDSNEDYAKDAHKRALKKAWALWKQGKGPKPVWSEK